MTRSTAHRQAPDTAPELGPRPAVQSIGRSGALVITSGQTAHVNGVNIATGLVGRDVDLTQARDCAWVCARNVVSALDTALDGLDDIASIIRVTVYVASAPGFTDQHLVADAATEYFHRVFGDAGAHARAAIGVAALPTDSPVEVEAIVELCRG